MLEILFLSDEEYEYLAKAIAMGIGIGIIVGVVIDNITLAFSLGGIIGIVWALIYICYKKLVRKSKKFR